jgi:hypothetical protein
MYVNGLYIIILKYMKMTHVHDLNADEDSGGDDGELAQEEDEGADRIERGHPQDVVPQRREGLPGPGAEVDPVNGWKIAAILRLFNLKLQRQRCSRL